MSEKEVEELKKLTERVAMVLGSLFSIFSGSQWPIGGKYYVPLRV